MSFISHGSFARQGIYCSTLKEITLEPDNVYFAGPLSSWLQHFHPDRAAFSVAYISVHHPQE